MRPHRVWRIALVAVFGTAAPALAQHHEHHHVPVTHPEPVAHHPGGGAPAPTAPPAAGAPSSGVIVDVENVEYNTNYYTSNYGGYGGGLAFGYTPVRFFGYPRYGYGYYGGYGPYVLPPLVLPAQTLFGPQPVQQMMGMGVNVGGGPGFAGPAGPVAGGQAGGGQMANPPAARQRKPRVSNAEAKARAGKFIDFGDALFAKQQFRQALERYKLAAQQAPDMAEIYLRQGIALVAVGQYESAAKSFRRGVKLPDWNVAGMGIDQLYNGARAAKEAHIEALAMALRTAPHDANLLFVLGMEMFLSGQPERASAFFARAAQLGGNEDHLLDGFLPAAQPAAAPQPGMAPRPGVAQPNPGVNAGVNL